MFIFRRNVSKNKISLTGNFAGFPTVAVVVVANAVVEFVVSITIAVVVFSVASLEAAVPDKGQIGN